MNVFDRAAGRMPETVRTPDEARQAIQKAMESMGRATIANTVKIS